VPGGGAAIARKGKLWGTEHAMRIYKKQILVKMVYLGTTKPVSSTAEIAKDDLDPMVPREPLKSKNDK
jgi:hypothetical protein